MNPQFQAFLQLLFRWIHVTAGILWLGQLWFLNWVSSTFQTTLDPEGKAKINPELLPRILYWFRWGAAWTWLSGFLLLGLVYYGSRETLFESGSGSPLIWLGILLVIIIAGYLLYNSIAKALKNKDAAAALSLGLYVAAYLLFEHVGHFSGRALYLHAGALFGTVMAMNAWMVIWPRQRRVIQALRSGNPLPPDAPDVQIPALRSRHNTYMSVPLIFMMISNHYPTIYSDRLRDVYLVIAIIVGFVTVRLLYGKSSTLKGM